MKFELKKVTDKELVKICKMHEKQVVKWGRELKRNKGVIPEKWIPFVAFIKAVLKFVEVFTGPKVDAIIEMILAAIEAWEKKK